MSEKKKWLHFGNVLKSKDKEDDNGNVIKKGSHYIEINKDVEFKKGDRVVMKKKSDQIRGLHKAGYITEEQMEEDLIKFDFIIFELLVPPREE